MQAQVKWVEGFQFLGESQSGHAVVMDGSGGKTAPSPMEMVLMAAGGCSSVDVVDGLKSAGQNVHSCVAKLTADRRDSAPKIFTAINIHFELTGDNLDEAAIEKAVSESLEKYCSVCIMLGAGVKMTHSWSII